jgi:hypothetical protein
MAENSVPFITYKQTGKVTGKTSVNDKIDFLVETLFHRLEVAHAVMSRHPNVLSEYNAVLSTAKCPEPDVTEKRQDFGELPT